MAETLLEWRAFDFLPVSPRFCAESGTVGPRKLAHMLKTVGPSDIRDKCIRPTHGEDSPHRPAFPQTKVAMRFHAANDFRSVLHGSRRDTAVCGQYAAAGISTGVKLIIPIDLLREPEMSA